MKCSLNQFCEVNLELAPEIDADLITNYVSPLTAEEIENYYIDELFAAAADDEGNNDKNDDNDKSTTSIKPPTRNNLDETIEIVTNLNLFTDNIAFDPLLSELASKITHKRLQTM